MIGLLLVGVVAGLLAGISPCILPVLPVVLVAGATGQDPAWPRHYATIRVGAVPKLYTLLQAGATTSGTLHLSVSPGVQAYAFTFG